MSNRQLLRLAAIANVLGGVAIAVFVIEHPWGRFVGAEVARTTAWQVAHALHFLGATGAVFGLLGLFVVQAPRLKPGGVLGFALAFAGTAFFMGTGMITAFVWPMVAAQAPDAVAAKGAMFDVPALTPLALTAITVWAGYLLFGVTSWRAGVLPRVPLVIWVVGAIVAMIPPEPLGPLPWAGLVAGGIAYGAGTAALGVWLWRHPEIAPA